MAEQTLRAMVETWSRDPDALRDLIHAPDATAARFGLSQDEHAALVGADELRQRSPRSAGQPYQARQRDTLSTITITGDPDSGSMLTFETGSTITGGGSTLTFETGSTLTFETGSTITGEPGSGSTITLEPITITGDPGGSMITMEPITITGEPGSGSTMTFETGTTITGEPGSGSTMTFEPSTITAEPSGGVLVRRDVWELMPDADWHPIVLAYARAVAVMQGRPASDPTSWTWQAAIHGSHNAVPPGARWNACQHRQWFFLPWHRMYLHHFERIVRAIVVSQGGPADWALPYWNYDQASPRDELPLAFRAPNLPGGAPNPLHIPAPGRDAAWDLGATVPPQASSSTVALAATSYTGVGGSGFGGGASPPAHFGGSTGAVEQTPHNVLHPLIGGFAGSGTSCNGAGLMTDPDCAGLDPIFWLHHANIDRLWSRWLDQGRSNPTQNAWLSQQFTLYDENGNETVMTCDGVVDSAAQLGYVYDDQPVFDQPVTPGPTPPEPQEPPELAGATEETLELVGRPVSVQLRMPEPIHPVQADEGGDGRHLYLNVEDIEAERDPKVPYAVYLEPAGDAATGEATRQHVGNITLFGLDKMNDPDRAHDGPPGWRHTFEVTRAVDRLARAGGWDPNAMNVTFEPLRPRLPPGVHLPPSDEPGERPPVRIGRVSLFVARS